MVTKPQLLQHMWINLGMLVKTILFTFNFMAIRFPFAREDYVVSAMFL